LPARSARQLAALGDVIDLRFAQRLHAQDQRVARVYFPISGYVSLIAERDGSALEVMVVGREGVVGCDPAMGVPRSATTALVQAEGQALCIRTAAFVGEVQRNQQLRAAVQRYTVFMVSSVATSATCINGHLLPARLARWLLMAHDRVRSRDLLFTHEFLSTMLGVRRVGVTNAATELQRQGIIGYHRGVVSILDRAELLKAACSCYAADRTAYARIMKTRATKSS